MEEQPSSMSTIEKAAAKLAASKAAIAKNPEQQHVPVERAALRTDRIPAGITERDLSAIKPGVVPAMAPLQLCDINLEHLADKGFLSPSSGRSQLALEMRRIKRPLLLSIQKAEVSGDSERPINLIMITSALPGEGKTFIAINLAISLAAELDRKVLLVDGDIARGDVSRQLEIQNERGLADLIQETNYLAEDCVLTSNIERLSVLPAGQNNDHMDELFASEMMSRLTKEIATADPERIIIFDTSPLLSTTEAAVLAQYMGQVVMVVEANKTPQDAVAQAVIQLEACANVSMLLNKTNHQGFGGYGYGYGYGDSADRNGRVNARDQSTQTDDNL